jgi:hypothetical protein
MGKVTIDDSRLIFPEEAVTVHMTPHVRPPALLARSNLYSRPPARVVEHQTRPPRSEETNSQALNGF